ncbi:uncharacterized protein L969DRAFT_54986 [Mixia osmundae IAM 14324]|uniref:Golgi apparatus membrane protein TVP23 n=1 Tax=Mixia osmundae (strain CBS 9802 / IAM 14324 / JCM 22182 / KY 12970) TaxID=764103 RepID=G7E891_MIXOS|nr:uncharacterized protein L969DRAFT_54986 [Mixia osmundae IAM 14324]KEI36544.1 hypothetical protein L969DRAFT_54986 [Mixia osmundae IAM 14324]GAA99051.1 hypothetical protein E5Q_05740 [Mixia osmundae IAM 14324]
MSTIQADEDLEQGHIQPSGTLQPGGLATAQPQSSADPQLSIWQQSSHPVALFFLFAFRSAAVATYLLCGFFSNSYVFSTVLVVVLLSADFWTVRNVSGRVLVGLRFWNQVDEDGTSYWVFESRDPTQPANAVDSRMFWVALYTFPVVWFFLLFIGLFSSISFIPIVILALVFNVTNTIGFSYADRDAKRKWATGMAANSMFGGLGGVGGTVISGLLRSGMGKVFGPRDLGAGAGAGANLVAKALPQILRTGPPQEMALSDEDLASSTDKLVLDSHAPSLSVGAKELYASHNGHAKPVDIRPSSSQMELEDDGDDESISSNEDPESAAARRDAMARAKLANLSPCSGSILLNPGSDTPSPRFANPLASLKESSLFGGSERSRKVSNSSSSASSPRRPPARRSSSLISTSTKQSSTSPSSAKSPSLTFAPLPEPGRKRASSITLGVAARASLLNTQAGNNPQPRQPSPSRPVQRTGGSGSPWAQTYQVGPAGFSNGPPAWYAGGPLPPGVYTVDDVGRGVKAAWKKLKKRSSSRDSKASLSSSPTRSESGSSVATTADSDPDPRKPADDTIHEADESETFPDAVEEQQSDDRHGRPTHRQPDHVDERLRTKQLEHWDMSTPTRSRRSSVDNPGEPVALSHSDLVHHLKSSVLGFEPHEAHPALA